MPCRVRHRLERDPVRRNLDRRGQAFELVGRVDLDSWMVGGAELLDLLPQRPTSETIERRWGRTRTRAGARRRPSPSARPRRLRRVEDEQVLGRLRLERSARERRSQAVVEIAAQAPALLLSSGHQALPRPLQLRGFGDERRVGTSSPVSPRVRGLGIWESRINLSRRHQIWGVGMDLNATTCCRSGLLRNPGRGHQGVVWSARRSAQVRSVL